MKIIKNTMVEPITKECEDCKSVFSFTYDEIQRERDTNILGMVYHRRYVVCPVCKYTNNLGSVCMEGQVTGNE